MFECDEDLGLDEEPLTREDFDNSINEALKNIPITVSTDQQSNRMRNFEATNKTRNVPRFNHEQTNRIQDFPKYGNSSRLEHTNITESAPPHKCLMEERRFTNPMPRKSTDRGNNAVDVSGSDGVKGFSDLCKENSPDSESRLKNGAELEVRKTFKEPNCDVSRGKSGCLNEDRNIFGDIVFEDDDFSDAFTEDITFDVEEKRIVKRPKTPDKSSRKRKFPGPAGILPESPVRLNSMYKSSDGDEVQSIDAPITDFPCTQEDSSQFTGCFWLKMCEDFSGSPTFLPDYYNIAWIKSQAKSKIVHGHKAPFLAAIIIHVKQFDSKTLNTFITLKDASGQINASLQSDLYETYKQDITVGSVIALRDFSVLTLSNSANIYITITPKNLLVIYSASGLRQQETQSQPGCTLYAHTTPKVTNVQDIPIKDVIDDALNFKLCNGGKENTNFCDITDAEKRAFFTDDFGDVEEASQNANTPKRMVPATLQSLSNVDYISGTENQSYHNIFNYQSNLRKNNASPDMEQIKYKSSYETTQFHQGNAGKSQFNFGNPDNDQSLNERNINFSKLKVANDNRLTDHDKPNDRNTMNNHLTARDRYLPSNWSNNCNNANSRMKDLANFNNNTMNDNLSARDRYLASNSSNNANSRMKNLANFNNANTSDNISLLNNKNVTIRNNEKTGLFRLDRGGNNATISDSENSALIYSNSSFTDNSNGGTLSKIQVNAAVHVDAKSSVGNTDVFEAGNAEETKKKSNIFDRFRFKKRTSDEKENGGGDYTRPEYNENVESTIGDGTNADRITFTQISVLSEDREHSQILEEAFEGVDASSLFEEF